MQNDASNQIDNYIHQELSSGTDETAIRHQLARSGWSDTLINEAFYRVSPETQTMPTGLLPSSDHSNTTTHTPAPITDDKRVRNGVLWIVSPFILLIGTALLSFGVRLAGINSVVFYLIFMLMGIAGVILIIAGPIIGIIKLSKHN